MACWRPWWGLLAVIFLFGWNGKHQADFGKFNKYAAADMTEPHQAAGLFLLDATAMKQMAGEAEVLVDDLPARLGETLTLIDTGSDFLSAKPINKPDANHQLAIGTTIFNHLQPPSHYFTGLTAADTKKILKERQEKLILLPRQEKPPPVTDEGPSSTSGPGPGTSKQSASPGSASGKKKPGRASNAQPKAPVNKDRRGFLLQIYDPHKLIQGDPTVMLNGVSGAQKTVHPRDDGKRINNDVTRGDNIYSAPVPDFSETTIDFVVQSQTLTWKVRGALDIKKKDGLIMIKLDQGGKAVTMSADEALGVYAPPPGSPPPPPPPPSRDPLKQ